MNHRGKSGKRRFVHAVFAILPALLLIAALVPVFLVASKPAGAMSPSDAARIRSYVSSYISNQFGTGGSEGEDGFLISPAALHSRLNSYDDGTILGEGDDAANAPILVDNLGNNASWIPGTSNRCMWNTGAGGSGTTQNCFDNSMLDQIKARADAHAAAGFSTDIVVYCLSGNTEAPTTGAFGYIAQTGRLLSDGSVPKVYALKWGRNGWTNTVSAHFAANLLAAPVPSSTYTLPVPFTNCSSASGDAELVRCQAQWAIYNGIIIGVSGGNVGGGQIPGGASPNQTLTTGQIVDIRTGNPQLTVKYGTVPTNNIPDNVIFGSGLVNVNPTASNGVLVVSRTPMMGGIIAEGLRMLGENMSPGGFLNGGIARWNSSQGEKQTSDGQTRPPLTINPIDTTAPVVTSIDVSNVTHNNATITRQAGEPATLKVEYGTSPGVYTNTVNSTVLNANKSVTLPGLQPGTTYFWQATSYDGMANGTTSAGPSTFTTMPEPDPTRRPDITPMLNPVVYWASYADYTARELSIDLSIANRGSCEAFYVLITGSSNTNGVTLSSPLPVSVGAIQADSSAIVTLRYHIPPGVGGMILSLQGSASDYLGISYTYP